MQGLRWAPWSSRFDTGRWIVTEYVILHKIGGARGGERGQAGIIFVHDSR